jgi:hypothetical protein
MLFAAASSRECDDGNFEEMRQVIIQFSVFVHHLPLGSQVL